MNTTYEKPSIRKLHVGLMNKFGQSPAYARKIRTEIDGVSIDELCSRFGSPLFVYSEKTIRRRHREMFRAFSNRYPNVVMSWSYKTNYLGAICSVMHQAGSTAEVVSEMEYEKARSLGIPGEKIIYNGPHKSLASLERAASEGAAINIDHLDELYDLETVAKKLGRKIPVGLRLNLDVGIYPQWTRFGFNLECGHALEAAKRIKQGGKLILDSLHCHLGTFILDPSAYARQVEKMIGFSETLRETLGLTINTLDLGGGFPSRSRLKGIYLPPEVSIPPIDDYAEAISQALYKNLPTGHFPRIILESGRALVDDSGYLITTLVASKILPDGSRSYVADAGINLLYTSNWYRFNIELDREVGGINEPSRINGPLCMNIDVIDEAASLPPLSRGTRLILSPVGAYNQTQSMQFIEYRPASILIGSNGEIDIIREREDLSDFVRREKIPTRFIHRSA